MKRLKTFFVLFLLFWLVSLTMLILPSSTINPSTSPPPTPRFKLVVPRINEIVYEITVTNPGDSDSYMRLDFALPKTWMPDTYIEIKRIGTTHGSLGNYTDRENDYMYVISNLKPKESMQINITFHSLKYKLEYYTHKRIRSTAPGEYVNYTRPEEYIESDDTSIVSMTDLLVRDLKNPFRIAETFYYFVISYLTYEVQPKIRGALWALQNRRGDCTEYGTLLVALLRAAGIPARVVTGHVSKELSQGGVVNATHLWVDSPHLWAEFYVDGFGWVPLDPTFGQSDPHPEDDFATCWSHYLPILKGPTMEAPYRALITLKPPELNFTARLLVTPLSFVPFTNPAIHEFHQANNLTNALRREAYRAYEYEFNITETHSNIQETYDILQSATHAIQEESPNAEIYAQNASQNALITLEQISNIVKKEGYWAVHKAWRELRVLGALSGGRYLQRAETCYSIGDYANFILYAYYARATADSAPNIVVFIGPTLLCGFTVWMITRKRTRKKYYHAGETQQSLKWCLFQNQTTKTKFSSHS